MSLAPRAGLCRPGAGHLAARRGGRGCVLMLGGLWGTIHVEATRAWQQFERCHQMIDRRGAGLAFDDKEGVSRRQTVNALRHMSITGLDLFVCPCQAIA